jgi:UDP-N-acetylmuramoyl-tripeptide--D-alanyl-D-alanine ligase
MKIFITILWFLLLTKCLFFWLWLWQLKEYHFGRFRAHFETQKGKKLISSFWRIKFPKFTKKTIVVSASGILLEILILSYIYPLQDKRFYLLLLATIVFAPIIFSLLILLFQIPTAVLRKRILKRAGQKRKRFKHLLVIGITGSYGKTSTKEFLTEILSERFKVLKTKKHINSEIGIAQTILNELEEGHQIFIAEIGAYERGKIREVCEMLKPQIGILTGINEQHLSTFGSQENIIRAKFELIEALSKDGLAVFNGYNKYCRQLFQKTTKPKKIISTSTGIFSTVVGNMLSWDVENFLLAVAVAKKLGMSREGIIRAAKTIKSQIKIRKGINDTDVIDSAYSTNPHSVMAHLDYLKTLPNKKVIIMPCLIELGKMSKEVHRRIGEMIGKICDLAIITTKDRFGELREGARKSGMPKEKILLIENPKEIFEKIKTFCQPGDTILLESRVPKNLLRRL